MDDVFGNVGSSLPATTLKNAEMVLTYIKCNLINSIRKLADEHIETMK